MPVGKRSEVSVTAQAWDKAAALGSVCTAVLVCSAGKAGDRLGLKLLQVASYSFYYQDLASTVHFYSFYSPISNSASSAQLSTSQDCQAESFTQLGLYYIVMESMNLLKLSLNHW